MTFKFLEPEDIFQCKQCGDCCRGYGGTFVTDEDVKTIAEYLKSEPEYFLEKYCQMSCGKPVLTQSRDDYCIFWDGLCTIHPVKPRMCRAWPFIESVLVDIGNWYIMAASCPGIRIDVPESIVKKCVDKAILTCRP